jgi:hypothetical protein
VAAIVPVTTKGYPMQSKVTRDEYISFFTNWVFYQFDRPSNRIHNILVIREVAKLVTDNEEAAYWGGRDCWTMHDIACKVIADRAIVAVEA